MLTRRTALAAGLALSLILAACGGSGEEATGDEAAATPASTPVATATPTATPTVEPTPTPEATADEAVATPTPTPVAYRDAHGGTHAHRDRVRGHRLRRPGRPRRIPP